MQIPKKQRGKGKRQMQRQYSAMDVKSSVIALWFILTLICPTNTDTNTKKNANQKNKKMQIQITIE